MLEVPLWNVIVHCRLKTTSLAPSTNRVIPILLKHTRGLSMPTTLLMKALTAGKNTCRVLVWVIIWGMIFL